MWSPEHTAAEQPPSVELPTYRLPSPTWAHRSNQVTWRKHPSASALPLHPHNVRPFLTDLSNVPSYLLPISSTPGLWNLSPSMLTGDFGFTLKNPITTYKKQEQTQTQQVQSHHSLTSLLLPSSHSQGTSSSLFNVLCSMSLMFWQLFLNSMVSPI